MGRLKKKQQQHTHRYDKDIFVNKDENIYIHFKFKEYSAINGYQRKREF